MQLNKRKNTMIIKNVESNLIDEAILILKPNIKLKQNYEKNNKFDNIITNEAQKIINDYVNNIQNDKRQRDIIKLKKRYRISQIFNLALIISIAVIIEILI